MFEKEITKEDAEMLDWILIKCEDDEECTDTDFKNHFESDQSTFRCLKSTIEDYNVAETGRYYVRCTDRTIRFNAYGGFAKKYEEQEQKRKDVENQRVLVKENIKQIRTNTKNIKWNKTTTIISIIIAVISLIISIFKGLI